MSDYHILFNETKEVLREVSLSRIYQHYSERGFFMITGWKHYDECCNPVSDKINKENMRSIKSDLRREGYGFIDAKGFWEGKCEPLNRCDCEDPKASFEYKAEEESLIVPLLYDKKRTLKHALGLASKYSQDAVLVVSVEDGKPESVLYEVSYTCEAGDLRKSNIEGMVFKDPAYKFKGIQFNVDEDFFTELQRGGTFSLTDSTSKNEEE